MMRFLPLAALLLVGCASPRPLIPYVDTWDVVVEAPIETVQPLVQHAWPAVPIAAGDPDDVRPWIAHVSPHDRGTLVRLRHLVGSWADTSYTIMAARMDSLEHEVRYAPVSAGFAPLPVQGDPTCLYLPGETGPPPAADADAEPGDLAEMLPSLEEGMVALQRSIRYPEQARRAGIQGRVVVQFVVNASGVPTCLTIRSSPYPIFNDVALEAVARTRFRPSLIEGEPANTTFLLPISFRLR